MIVEPFPIPTKLLLETPLYQEITFSEKQILGVIEFIYWQGIYDAYCIVCKKETPFKMISKNRPPEYNPKLVSMFTPVRNSSRANSKVTIDKGVYVLEAQCTRQEGHRHIYVFHVDYKRQPWHPYGFKCSEGSITKIGQYPSYAEFNLSEVDKYKSVLVDKQRSEIVRAIGLAAHGIGIGAFVYLRRIFEALVEEAHKLAKSANEDFDEISFNKARMDEKLIILRELLPSTLCENAKLYSILSVGIHDLSEEECNKYFVIVKSGIEMILNEKLRKLEEEKNKKSVEKELNQIHGDLKANAKSKK